jgi:dethiobiotin synthetase
MTPAPRTHRPATRGLGILVAGTDTAVGKTLISCALLRTARRLDLPLLPFKPSESGCLGGRPRDAAALRAAAGRPEIPLEKICPFPFRLPVAPAAAARLAGQTLTLPRILRAGRSLSRGAPLLLEGAGGLLSPYASNLTAADLALAFGLPLLLVARNALGTINHTALALAEIRRRRIPLLGLVLVTTAPARGLVHQQNATLIEELTGTPAAAVIPYFSSRPRQRLDAALQKNGVARRLLQSANLFI